MLLGSILIFTGCGKHEARGTALGTGAGAGLGYAVGGSTGALVGAAVGGVFGNAAGVDADNDVADEQVERRATQRQLAYEKSKPKTVVVNVTHPPKGQWCTTCYKNVQLSGARRCPDCGDALVHDKICGLCGASFSPRSAYRYCPYCPQRSRLEYR